MHKLAFGWSRSVTRYLTDGRRIMGAGPGTDPHREAFAASFWLGCWIVPFLALDEQHTLAVSWLLGAAGVVLGVGLWASASALCRGLGLPRWQAGAVALLALIPGANLLVYIGLSVASGARWGPLWTRQAQREDRPR